MPMCDSCYFDFDEFVGDDGDFVSHMRIGLGLYDVFGQYWAENGTKVVHFVDLHSNGCLVVLIFARVGRIVINIPAAIACCIVACCIEACPRRSVPHNTISHISSK